MRIGAIIAQAATAALLATGLAPAAMASGPVAQRPAVSAGIGAIGAATPAAVASGGGQVATGAVGPADPDWLPGDDEVGDVKQAAAEAVADAPDSGPVTVSTVQADPNDPTAAPVIVDKVLPSKKAAETFAAGQLTKQTTAGIEVPVARKAQAIPSDPKAGEQYQHATDELDTVNAWATTKGSGVIVGVIDSGVDGSHPDLKGRVLPGKDFTTPMVGKPGADGWNDDVGHGTHVAGIIAANADNAIGGAGIAPQSSILPVRVLGATSTGTSTSEARGIIWAVDNGAKVLNISLGGSYSFAEDAAIRYAVLNGVVVVAAAGNDSGMEGFFGPSYPAALPDVTSVGATTESKAHASYSTSDEFVDVSAPGDDIVSTEPGGRYGEMSGTSMASPMVAGVAALVRAARPAASQADVRAIMSATARDVGPAGRDDQTGYGIVDAAAAVARAVSGPMPTRTTPSITVTRSPNLAKDQYDTQFVATLSGGSLTPGQRGLALYTDGTSSWDLLGTDSVFGTSSWRATLWGDGSTADYYIGFPGDDLYNPVWTAPIALTYGSKALKPVSLSIGSVARTKACPEDISNQADMMGVDPACFAISVKAATKDGSPAVGTISAFVGQFADGDVVEAQLAPSGTTWSAKVYTLDFDPAATDDALFSAYAPPQDLSRTAQMKGVTAANVTIKGKPTAVARPSLHLTYQAAGTSYSESSMAHSIELDWGQCVPLTIDLARSNAEAATGTRVVGVYNSDAISLAQDPDLAETFPGARPVWATLKASADGSKWTGSLKFCPEVYSPDETYALVYPGSATEASSTSNELLRIQTNPTEFTGAFSPASYSGFVGDEVRVSGTFKAKSGPTEGEDDYAIALADSSGDVNPSEVNITVGPSSVSFTATMTLDESGKLTATLLNRTGDEVGSAGPATVKVKAKAASSLRASASVKSIVFGSALRVRGSLKVAGKAKAATKIKFCRSTRLTARSCRVVTTDKSGGVSLKVKPIRNSRYWFEYSGASGVGKSASHKVTVKVKPRLKARAIARHTLRITSAPNGEPFKVTIQKKTGSTWKDVKQTRSSINGRLTVRGLKAGTYRAYYRATLLNAGKYSRAVRVR